MYAAVPALIAEVNDDPHVRVLVVRGEGTTFSAGSDIPDSEPNGWVTPTSTTTR
ncbi:MAG: hypothetical protein Ct9H300mP12_16570 [Acidimicrobiales bacterium]|nr:MAG: hypothetical protein Ct9H300mP12_16570 [Acidimicrobiales bacterium]